MVHLSAYERCNLHAGLMLQIKGFGHGGLARTHIGLCPIPLSPGRGDRSMAWTREELDKALRNLDREIEPMLASSVDATHFLTMLQEEAARIEQHADRYLPSVSAELNRLLVSHELLPRVRAMRRTA
jgi:hypothetical protein